MKAPYRGITWHAGKRKWRLRVRVNGKYVHFAYFDNPKQCAELREFVVRLVQGPDPAHWHYNAEQSNFPIPGTNLDDRLMVIRKLLDAQVLSRDSLREKLHAYDAYLALTQSGDLLR